MIPLTAYFLTFNSFTSRGHSMSVWLIITIINIITITLSSQLYMIMQNATSLYGFARKSSADYSDHRLQFISGFTVEKLIGGDNTM